MTQIYSNAPTWGLDPGRHRSGLSPGELWFCSSMVLSQYGSVLVLQLHQAVLNIIMCVVWYLTHLEEASRELLQLQAQLVSHFRQPLTLCVFQQQILTHAQMHAHIRTHIRTHAHGRTHSHTQTHTNTHAQMCGQADMHSRDETCRWIHPFIQTEMVQNTNNQMKTWKIITSID